MFAADTPTGGYTAVGTAAIARRATILSAEGTAIGRSTTARLGLASTGAPAQTRPLPTSAPARQATREPGAKRTLTSVHLGRARMVPPAQILSAPTAALAGRDGREGPAPLILTNAPDHPARMVPLAPTLAAATGAIAGPDGQVKIAIKTLMNAPPLDAVKMAAGA